MTTTTTTSTGEKYSHKEMLKKKKIGGKRIMGTTLWNYFTIYVWVAYVHIWQGGTICGTLKQISLVKKMSRWSGLSLVNGCFSVDLECSLYENNLDQFKDINLNFETISEESPTCIFDSIGYLFIETPPDI